MNCPFTLYRKGNYDTLKRWSWSNNHSLSFMNSNFLTDPNWSSINKYHRHNKLGRRCNSFFWYKSIIIIITLKIHIKACVDYCDIIYSLSQLKSSVILTKNTFLKLVTKYHEASKWLLSSKKGFVEKIRLKRMASLRTTYMALHS